MKQSEAREIIYQLEGGNYVMYMFSCYVHNSRKHDELSHDKEHAKHILTYLLTHLLTCD